MGVMTRVSVTIALVVAAANVVTATAGDEPLEGRLAAERLGKRLSSERLGGLKLEEVVEKTLVVVPVRPPKPSVRELRRKRAVLSRSRKTKRVAATQQ